MKRNFFLESDDPEVREILAAIDRGKRLGFLKEPPRRAADIKTFHDLCLYIFKLAKVDGRYQLLLEEGIVKRWVWAGHEFTDRHVSTTRSLFSKLSEPVRLEELRLVDTKVSANGVAELQRLFPMARLTIYTAKDSPDWAQAYYSGEPEGDDEWRLKMTQALTSYLERSDN